MLFISSSFSLLMPRQPTSTLFPYTTLFRSCRLVDARLFAFAAGHQIGNLLGERHVDVQDRKSTRLNSSHTVISYAVFCLKKKNFFHDTAAHADLLTERNRLPETDGVQRPSV